MPTATIKVHGPPRYMQMLNTSINVLLAEYRKLGLITTPTTTEDRLLHDLFGMGAHDDNELQAAGERQLREFVMLALKRHPLSINGECVSHVISPTNNVFIYDVSWTNAGGFNCVAQLDLRVAHASRRINYTVA